MRNIFRLVGDMMHLASFGVLLKRMKDSQSCTGISCKTQELYLIVFLARYLDLFLYTVSLYNTAMKVAFIALTACIVCLMRFHRLLKLTNDQDVDDFPYLTTLLPGAFVLGMIFNYEFSLKEVLWSFSVFLESVAILPQMFLLWKLRRLENLTSHYVFLMGAYRTMYVFNWVWRYYNGENWSWLVVVPGVVQSLLYVDFFYYYIVAQLTGQPVTVAVYE
jgi:ER lumen protein retaining receptor